MLDTIKSYFFMKKVMSLLSSKICLDLIKYNNNLKIKLDINILNYKILSGKYTKRGKEGIVKEYDAYNDVLLFEGEYKNGKRNGKGKEYNKYGDLIFEGEFKNGKRWNGIGKDGKNDIAYKLNNGKGNVKEYKYEYDTIELIYEGEYLNGERNGKGIEYDDYYNFKYECEFLCGKKNGKGKIYENENLVFEGVFKNDKPWNGKIPFDDKRVVKNGKAYISEGGKLKLGYIFFKEDGYHSDYDESDNDLLEFEGEYINDEKNGKGKEYDYIGEKVIFEGEYIYNHKIKGKEFYSDGKIEFEGDYLYDRKWNGKGYDENGNVIYELIDGNGKVKEYVNFDLKYIGEFKNGKRNGRGKSYDHKLLLFDGEFLNDKIWNGKGKIYFDDNLEFEGEYKNGEKNGKGKEYDHRNGELLFDGEYLNNERWNGKVKKYDYYNKLIFEGEYLNGQIEQNNIDKNLV